MPSFVRDLFKTALAFPGNRSGLCISRDEQLVRLRLDVRCLDDGGAQTFLCEAIPLSLPIPVTWALCQGHPVSCCCWMEGEGLKFPAEGASGCTEDQQLIGWK